MLKFVPTWFVKWLKSVIVIKEMNKLFFCHNSRASSVCKVSYSSANMAPRRTFRILLLKLFYFSNNSLLQWSVVAMDITSQDYLIFTHHHAHTPSHLTFIIIWLLQLNMGFCFFRIFSEVRHNTMLRTFNSSTVVTHLSLTVLLYKDRRKPVWSTSAPPFPLVSTQTYIYMDVRKSMCTHTHTHTHTHFPLLWETEKKMQSSRQEQGTIYLFKWYGKETAQLTD